MGNSPSSVPYGAQIAYLNISTICNGSFYDYEGPPQLSSGIQSYVQVSVTAPLLSNGQFNYTDLHVSTAPATFNYQLDIKTTATFTTNASPGTFSISSDYFVAYSAPALDIPYGNGVTTSPPITIGSGPAQLSLVRIDIDAENADIIIKSTCFASPNIITTTGNGQSQAGSSSPANGFRTNITTPLNTTSNIGNLPLSCGGSLIFGGNVPAFVAKGSSILLNKVNAFYQFVSGSDPSYSLQLGKDTSNNNVIGLSAALAGSQLVETDVSREFAASDSSTTNPLSGSTNSGGSGQSLSIALPNKGYLSKSFTNNGSPFSLSVKSLQGTLSSKSATNFLGCTVGGNTLLSAPVV